MHGIDILTFFTRIRINEKERKRERQRDWWWDVSAPEIKPKAAAS